MTKRELKCITQRVATRLESHEDTLALVNEVGWLRQMLNEIRDTTREESIAEYIDLHLERS